MKLIRTTPITASKVVSSSVPETVADAAAYAAGTTYALGAYASVTVNDDVTFYESLQAGNIGNTPASSPTWWLNIGTGQVVWSSIVTYLVGETVTYNNRLYECLVQNTAKQPDLYTSGTPTYWLDLGATNRMKMFDDRVGSQTIRPESLTITIAPGEIVDSLVFLDVEATLIEILITDPVEGVVFDEEIDLVLKSPVTDWYSYFFAPIISRTSAVLMSIPPYSNAEIEVTISNPGGTAKIGTFAVGTYKTIGATDYGISYGIKDYSTITEDAFGNTYVVERKYSKDVDAVVSIDTCNFDDIALTLSSYRATAAIWVGTDTNHSSFIVYGLCRSFKMVASTMVKSMISMKILGLT